MKRFGFAALSTILSFCLCAVFILSSCERKSDTEIIVEAKNVEELGELCGFSPLTPDFSDVSSLMPSTYRALYGFVAETEYFGENGLTAIFRMADGGYTVSNLSGYADMGLEDIYVYSETIEFEILTREHVYACEWRGTVDGVDYQFSLTLIDGTLVDMRKLLRTIPDLCDEVHSDNFDEVQSFDSESESETANS